MKYANATAGYDSVRYKGKDPWYQHPVFPLIPQFEYRPGDKWNENNWSFSWLFLRVWTLAHFSFTIGAEIESTGLNITANFTWLRIVIRAIPMPYVWLDFLHRKPAIQKSEE